MAAWQCPFALVPVAGALKNFPSLAAALDDESIWQAASEPKELWDAADDHLGRRDSWDGCELWGQSEGTCLEAHRLGRRIVEVCFRIDLRVRNQKAILPMLAAMRQSSLHLVKEDGEVIRPEWEMVAFAIKSSQAWSFLHSPEAYLDSLLVLGAVDDDGDPA